MKLLMFDIDGTLIDSMKIEEILFKDAIQKALEINEIDTNWNNYSHATDHCILKELVKINFNKTISKNEIDSFINLFRKNIEFFIKNNPDELLEINGAKNFFEEIKTYSDFKVSIATGGYGEIAQLKLNKIGIDISSIPFSSSHNGLSREEIMKDSEEKAKYFYNVEKFEEIIYFGDALWDYKACKNLNYKFIAVTSDKNKFRDCTIDNFINNYSNIQKIIDIL